MDKRRLSSLARKKVAELVGEEVCLKFIGDRNKVHVFNGVVLGLTLLYLPCAYTPKSASL